MNINERHKLRCEWLSPIHIGTGEELEPFDYIIKDNFLFRLSFTGALTAMSETDRQEAGKLIDKGRIIALRKFISEKVDPAKHSIFSTPVRYEVENEYKSKLDDINNQLLVQPFFRSTTNHVPVLPGSSIKGAIRTAVVSERGKNSNLPRPRGPRDWSIFEQNILSYKDAKDDPFRAITIRDAESDTDSTVVADVKNAVLRNNTLQVNSISLVLEMGFSKMTGREVMVETELIINSALIKASVFRKPVHMDEVVRACKNFYRPKMEEEHKKFYRGSPVEPFSESLLATSFGATSFPLRVGRFSGVESVTLDKYRDPRPPGNKTVWGKSRNLAEGLYPMGWVKVTVI